MKEYKELLAKIKVELANARAMIESSEVDDDIAEQVDLDLDDIDNGLEEMIGQIDSAIAEIDEATNKA